MRLLAFDLDGVLYSSEPFLGDAYREAIARVNAARPGALPRVPPTREILAHIGWPVSVILTRLFPDADGAVIALLHAATLDVICHRVARGDGILYPDVRATLERLRRPGRRLAVASNGRTRYVETVLAAYDLARFFVDRITADDVGDKTAVLRGYVARLGVTPAETVMIGDRASDVEAAHAVGCRFVGCDYGHGHRDEIAAAGPLVARFADLPGVIDAIEEP
jgi:phosphoglycolate phosphatase